VALQAVFDHYMPDDPAHSRCWNKQHGFCKTAFGNAANRSSALKSPLPIGMRPTFEKWIYSEILTDQVIEYFLKPGVTSWNESLNGVIHRYADKTRFLGPLSYEGIVARGVLQWNDPLNHIRSELEFFGLSMCSMHMDWMEKQLNHREYVTEYSQSHRRAAQRFREKYALPKVSSSEYVGKGGGFYE